MCLFVSAINCEAIGANELTCAHLFASVSVFVCGGGSMTSGD